MRKSPSVGCHGTVGCAGFVLLGLTLNFSVLFPPYMSIVEPGSEFRKVEPLGAVHNAKQTCKCPDGDPGIQCFKYILADSNSAGWV